MTPENFIQSLNLYKAVDSSELKKKHYEFSLIHLDLAPTAGFPTVHFHCDPADVVIRASLTPVLGMEKSTVNGLSYIFALMAPEKINAETVALIISSLLDTFSCTYLHPQNDMPELDPAEKYVFRLAIDREADYKDDVYVHTIVATIEVDDSAYARAIAIVSKQHEAIRKGMK